MAAGPPKAYLRQQTESVRIHLVELAAEEAPDLILVGRKDFILGIPELAARNGVSGVVQGHRKILYLSGRYPERRLLAEP